MTDDLIRDGRCRICGKSAVTQDVVDEWRAIDWFERDDDERHFRDDLCWREMTDECIDAAGNVIEDELMFVIERAEKAEAENARLRGLLADGLMSADCVWELNNGGHDWADWCRAARAALAVEVK